MGANSSGEAHAHRQHIPHSSSDMGLVSPMALQRASSNLGQIARRTQTGISLSSKLAHTQLNPRDFENDSSARATAATSTAATQQPAQRHVLKASHQQQQLQQQRPTQQPQLSKQQQQQQQQLKNSQPNPSTGTYEEQTSESHSNALGGQASETYASVLGRHALSGDQGTFHGHLPRPPLGGKRHGSKRVLVYEEELATIYAAVRSITASEAVGRAGPYAGGRSSYQAAEKKANPASRTNPSTPQREMLDMLSPKRTHKIPNRFINSPGNFPSALNSPGSLSPGGGADAEQTSKELTTPAKKPSPQHRGTEVGSQAMAAARIQKSASAVPFFNKSAIGQPPVAVQPAVVWQMESAARQVGGVLIRPIAANVPTDPPGPTSSLSPLVACKSAAILSDSDFYTLTSYDKEEEEEASETNIATVGCSPQAIACQTTTSSAGPAQDENGNGRRQDDHQTSPQNAVSHICVQPDIRNVLSTAILPVSNSNSSLAVPDGPGSVSTGIPKHASSPDRPFGNSSPAHARYPANHHNNHHQNHTNSNNNNNNSDNNNNNNNQNNNNNHNHHNENNNHNNSMGSGDSYLNLSGGADVTMGIDPTRDRDFEYKSAWDRWSNSVHSTPGKYGWGSPAKSKNSTPTKVIYLSPARRELWNFRADTRRHSFPSSDATRRHAPSSSSSSSSPVRAGAHGHVGRQRDYDLEADSLHVRHAVSIHDRDMELTAPTSIASSTDLWNSLPDEVLCQICAYVTVHEHFSSLVRVSHALHSFLYRVGLAAWPRTLRMYEDRKGRISLDLDGRRLAPIPDRVASRLGHLGFHAIGGCGPTSLRLLANPETERLECRGLALTNLGMAPLAGMLNLTELELRSCHGAGPTEPVRLTQLRGKELTRLDIREDAFSATAPPVLLDGKSLACLSKMPLKSLTLLMRSEFRSAQSAPGRLSSLLPQCLPHLQQLRLQFAHMTDEVFPMLAYRFPTLTSLDLTGQGISGDGLQHLSRSGLQLRELGLRSTAVTDDKLRQLHGLPLERLDLTVCGGVSSAGLQYLREAKLPLTDLDVSYTLVNDEGLAQLIGLRLLRLNLTGCPITGSGLAHLANLPLEELNLSHTAVTDASLAPLHSLPLRRIILKGTRCSQAGMALAMGYALAEGADRRASPAQQQDSHPSPARQHEEFTLHPTL